MKLEKTKHCKYGLNDEIENHQKNLDKMAKENNQKLKEE